MPGAFDIVVGLIMLISVVMAFCRGFVKEFFTVLSWILATIITIYASPIVQDLFEVPQGKKAFYDAVSILVIFSLSMLFFSFLFGKVISHLKKNNGLFLDRSLGVLFGVIRGGLFICLGYIFIMGFIYDEKPDWIYGKSFKAVEYGSTQLIKLNPKNMDIDLNKMIPDGKKTSRTEDDGGYSDDIRRQVDDLIENDLL